MQNSNFYEAFISAATVLQSWKVEEVKIFMETTFIFFQI
jgi:hypothetical protein